MKNERLQQQQPVVLIRNHRRIQHNTTSGPGPGGGNANTNTGVLSRETSKRWIPLYSNDTLTSASSPLPPSSSPNISSSQGLKASLTDLTNPPPSSSNLSKSHLLTTENSTANSSGTISNENSNAVHTYEPFSLLYQIEPAHLLRLMRTRLEAHRREFNNRPKCVPSTRSPLCTHHCVVILAARILTILCQDQTFQARLINTKENLTIIIDMLNINNDPVRKFDELFSHHSHPLVKKKQITNKSKFNYLDNVNQRKILLYIGGRRDITHTKKRAETFLLS